MEIKTDAAILNELVEDLKAKEPPNPSNLAYLHLQRYNDTVGDGFDIIKVVITSCGRLEDYVELLPRLKETNKHSFRAALNSFRNAFSLGNMGTRWDLFLNNLSHPVHTQALSFFDHLISSQDFWQSRAIDPDDAFDLINLLEDFIRGSAFPSHGKYVILSELTKMRFIINNIEKFGEQDYWERFERVTGIFGSLHSNLSDTEQKEAQGLLHRLVSKTNKVITTAANVSTIGQAALIFFIGSK